MPEEEIRKIRVHLLHDPCQDVFIFHHRVSAFVSPVAPGIIDDCCLAVADMVICSDYEACIHECDDHVEVPPGMLTESMDQLDDSFRLACRDIHPSLHLIAFIERLETNLMQHSSTSFTSTSHHIQLWLRQYILVSFSHR